MTEQMTTMTDQLSVTATPPVDDSGHREHRGAAIAAGDLDDRAWVPPDPSWLNDQSAASCVDA